MKTVLLISPFPPYQNPRLLKEYDTLKNEGYDVKVIYGVRDRWAIEKFQPGENFILVGGKFNSFVYLLSKIVHKLFIYFQIYELSANRTSFFLYLKSKSIKADIYIGHNLAALPIAVKMAKYYKVKCGFDAEDFHRQEVNDDTNSREYKLAKYLEDKYLPQVDYLTAASPLIAAEYKKLYPQLNPVVINNVFSSPRVSEGKDETTSKFKSPLRRVGAGLSLFWFSQTIGKGRGLEDVISALGILKNGMITFALLGNISSSTKEYFLQLASEKGLNESQLIFLNPVSPDEIFEIASKYDIGLALEQKTPFNRDICLTNKIFTYIISGIAVIASETKAQKQLIDLYPTIGKSFPIGDIENLAEIIKYYYENNDKLQKAKQAACALARNELNWELESEKFLNIVKSVI